MSWGDFVRNQVEKTLLQEGFSLSAAQGGQGMLRTYTTGCHKPAVKARFLMTRSDMADYGRRSKPALRSAVKLSERYERAVSRLGCSEKGESRTALTVPTFRCKNEEVIARSL